jgi:signal transduction histidine kinase
MEIDNFKIDKNIWKILQLRDGETSRQIKKATFDITFYLSIFFGILYSGIYYYLGADTTALIEIILLIISFPIIYSLRKLGKHYYAANLFVAIYVVILSSCAYFTGGVYSPSTLWLIIPPFLASVLLGTIEIIFWAIISIINISIIGFLSFTKRLPESEITSGVEEFYLFSFIALIIFILGFMLVTNLMRLRILLEAKKFQKDAQRNEYLATFAQVTAGLAHEINNPLTIALAHSKKLIKSIQSDPKANSDILNKSKKITESIERISKLIISMKNLSRDENQDEVTTFYIRDLIADVSNVFENSFNESNVNFDIDYNGLDKIEVTSHRIQLGQVLFNLIKNSYDEVSKLSIKEILVSIEKEDNFLKIKVLDSGEGVTKELTDKIFSPFYSTKVVGQGTGLGLSLSLSMMKKNGGDLYIDSSNKKTCFVMIVPLV